MSILEEEISFSLKVPIDCKEVLNDMFIRKKHSQYVSSDDEKKKMLHLLKDFIRDIAYIYTNERKR